MRIAMMMAAILLAGCGTRAPDAGQQMYGAYCASCHGPGGQGDGPLAADLPVAPPDLTRLSAGNGGVFPYSDVMAQIHGYPGRFHVMPEFGTLLKGRRVPWKNEMGQTVDTPVALVQVTQYLVSIQQP